MKSAVEINREGTCCFCGRELGWYATKNVEMGGENRISCFWGKKDYDPAGSGCGSADLKRDPNRGNFYHYTDG